MSAAALQAVGAALAMYGTAHTLKRAQRRGRSSVGASEVGFITVQALAELDRKIKQLDSDYTNHFTAKGPNPDLATGVWPLWMEEQAFFGRWVIWSNQTFRIGDEATLEFRSFEREYNDFLRALQDAGGKTQAKRSEVDLEAEQNKGRDVVKIIGLAATVGFAFLLVREVVR